jgi:hypothetical protein
MYQMHVWHTKFAEVLHGEVLGTTKLTTPAVAQIV